MTLTRTAKTCYIQHSSSCWIFCLFCRAFVICVCVYNTINFFSKFKFISQNLNLFFRIWYSLSEFDLFPKNMNYFCLNCFFSDLKLFSPEFKFYPVSWSLTLLQIKSIFFHFTTATWRNLTSKSPPKWINSIYSILIFDLTSSQFLHRLVHRCLWTVSLMSDSIAGLW